ncbi:HD-GYP domain-containing protein [Curvibacter sp. CHRR-16]|uniref:HD-GYP domain-containing protein n=1 Tax=Curvibacter sp. CHRR-16 TaxID=2835872 RepID=UPI001BDADF7A|nr:HD-GYP domain-containing protein [Curvibacter sp. CHRR-16]MBT0569580.1 HD-GYP domain-containing protein [Curvibacter sp. CHRR-16]
MSLLNDIKKLIQGSTSNYQHHEDLLTSLLVMAWMVEARDAYTGGHLWRVSQFAQLLATRAGLPSKDVARITIGAFLHDLGKVSVPDHILGKKDRLTDEEYAVIKTHPEIGWRMLAGHPLAQLAEQSIRAHHETPNGQGYPRGLSGDEIAIDARIVGICDAFDAMTSTRPYRSGMPTSKALGIIRENLGSQFDPALGKLFIHMGEAGELNHIVGHSDAGIPLLSCLMCGPVITRPRSLSVGMHVYCPSCTGEYETQTEGGKGLLRITPTDKKGRPEDLTPQVDHDVIRDMVRATARTLLG